MRRDGAGDEQPRVEAQEALDQREADDQARHLQQEAPRRAVRDRVDGEAHDERREQRREARAEQRQEAEQVLPAVATEVVEDPVPGEGVRLVEGRHREPPIEACRAPGRPVRRTRGGDGAEWARTLSGAPLHGQPRTG